MINISITLDLQWICYTLLNDTRPVCTMAEITSDLQFQNKALNIEKYPLVKLMSNCNQLKKFLHCCVNCLYLAQYVLTHTKLQHRVFDLRNHKNIQVWEIWQVNLILPLFVHFAGYKYKFLFCCELFLEIDNI